jgi:predicted enzyme related to lactoylglutathione lyase
VEDRGGRRHQHEEGGGVAANRISAVLCSADLAASRRFYEEQVGLALSPDVDGVATSPGIGRSAWFKDPDGNTIALFQPE